MRSCPLPCALAFASLACSLAEVRADVVINEIVAATSDRLVGTDLVTGAAKLGSAGDWRSPSFDDSGWSVGDAPLGASYGGLATVVSVQSDGEAAALYLRQNFTADAASAASGGLLMLDLDFDDGFIAFVNGREVARRNMGGAGSFAHHNQPAFNDRPAVGFGSIVLGVASDLLAEGENLIALQVHDVGDATLKIDAGLRVVGGASLVAVGSNWKYFVGSGAPSGGIYDRGVGGGDGGLDLEWTRVDFEQGGWSFGSSPIGYDASGDYPLSTDLGGAMRNITPSLYARFSFFSSPVQNGGTTAISAEVDYDDGFVLYLNGVEVARRNLGNPGTPVAHTALATASHGARWESGDDNPGALETIAIDPGLLVDGTNVLSVQLHNVSTGSSDLVFGAVVTATGASNRTLVGSGSSNWHFVGLGEPTEIVVPVEQKRPRFSDWIELHNTGAEAVDLEGWSLSDSEGDAGWVFPSTVIEPGGYLVVLASGKDIPNPVAGSPLMHTDFRLNGSGEFLGLFDATGALVSGFDPYPQQSFFHSYGRDTAGEYVYFELATPGAANGGVQYDELLDPPTIDTETGFYDDQPQAVMTPPGEGITVRYTTDGSTPTKTNGRVHTGGVIGADVQLREGSIGSILRESWFGVTGSTVASIPLGTQPGLVSNVSSATVPPDFTNNYGTRLHGWIHPPQTGEFTFWIACDDRGEAWLSDSEDPNAAVRIAHTPGATANSEFDRYPEQQSAPIPLQGGAKYYISILHKESTGSDHLRVQWEGPGVSRDTIRGGHLSPVVPETNAGTVVTVVKARSFRDGALPSEVVTRTFAHGYSPDMYHGPAVFLSGDEGKVFFAPDGATTIVGGSYDGSNRWFPNNANFDYNFASVEGRPFEREATIEVVMPDGTLGKRTDFGVRIAGSPHARPHYRPLDPSANWLGSWTSKPSLNFFFRDDYGDEALDLDLVPDQAPGGFGSLRLRAGKNDSSNPFIKDEIMRRISWATGQAASRGVFSNLWINGHYKAYFNLVERLRESFFQRHYATDAEWDIWHIREMVEGDRVHYDTTMNILRSRNMAIESNYADAEERVDMANYIDYVITNAYGATGDWPHNNYNLSRPRVEGGRWTFNVWDAEGSFGAFGNNINTNTLTEELGGSASGDTHMSRIVYRACKNSPEFRLLFADRIQKHFFNDGGLTQANLSALFEEAYGEFVPIYRAVRGGMPSRSFWDGWFPSRRNVLFNHFQGQGLWPSTAPPAFSRHGGEVSDGFALTINGMPVGGAIYYTTDGSDPRARGGGIAGQSYAAPLAIDRTTVVKARARSSGGEWSAVTEALFTAPVPPPLLITEIHFNPDGEDLTEFVEIQNIGDEVVDLTGIHFSSGLTFTFAGGTLAPGERLILVRDAAAFAAAYPGVAIGGVFEAGALDNGGERLVLAETGGREIVEADYGDSLDAADGGGFSLVLLPGADPSLEESWVSEYVLGGTPGDSIAIEMFSGDPDADDDGDRLSRLLEYALGTDPNAFTTSPWRARTGGLEIEWNIAAPDIDFAIEVSPDGETWSVVSGEVTLLGDGRARVVLPITVGLQMVRARCQLR